MWSGFSILTSIPRAQLLEGMFLNPKIQIIHVGSMTNKGTQALLKSEVSMLRETFNDAEIFVSTMDVDGVNMLGPPLENVIPGLIDVPYKKAGLRAKRLSYGRHTIKFKVDLLAHLFFVPLQAFIAFASSVLRRAGVGALYRAEVVDAFKNCDLVISTSDENFKEGNLRLPFNIAWMVTWWSLLFVRTCEVVIAKKIFKKRVIVFPNSVGPFRTFVGRLLARIAFKNVDLLLLRDQTSVANVKSLGVKTPTILTTDAAIIFKASVKNNLEKLETPTIGVVAGAYFNALKENEIKKYVAAHAKALDYMINKYDVSVVFLPHAVTGFKNDDYDMCASVLQRMQCKRKAKMIFVKNVDEYKLLLAQLDMLVSSKMHPAVLAASSTVPALYVVYDHKQTGFFEQLGLLDHCLDITAISYSCLVRKMESLWNSRKKVRRLLSQRTPELQENVKKAIRKAVLTFYSSEGPR